LIRNDWLSVNGTKGVVTSVDSTPESPPRWLKNKEGNHGFRFGMDKNPKRNNTLCRLIPSYFWLLCSSAPVKQKSMGWGSWIGAGEGNRTLVIITKTHFPRKCAIFRMAFRRNSTTGRHFSGRISNGTPLLTTPCCSTIFRLCRSEWRWEI